MKTTKRCCFFACVTILQAAAGVVTATAGETRGTDTAKLCDPTSHTNPTRIHVSDDGTQFTCTECGRRFIAWGFNYDHDDSGRLLEDYWNDEWTSVVEDFQEMKDLGANVVRVHLQLARFMETADKPNEATLKQLGRLIELAETTGLHLDITGLGCYHKQDVPPWYDAMDEAKRWNVQVLFWEAVAKTCVKSDAVFCYDLMNEPILPGGDRIETDWLGGAFGGKYFVQRISLDLAGRTREQVTQAWVRTLVAAIRKHDPRHMITVGVIPWALSFPGAKPLFYSEKVGEKLDFASVHFYPRKGEVDKALTALKTYDVGKPLLIEETFPLHCGIMEFGQFVDGSRNLSDGYVGFYWGKTIDEYRQRKDSIAAGIMAEWLEYFRTNGPEILDEATRDRKSTD